MNGAECGKCGKIQCTCKRLFEKNEEIETIEKVVDILIKLKGWRRKVIKWLWPDICNMCKILKDYCWKDCN